MGSPKPPSHGCAGQWSTFEAKPPPVGLDHNTHCTTQLKMCSALGYLSQALLTSSNSVVHLFKKNYYVLSTKENHVRAIYYVSKGLSVCTRRQKTIFGFYSIQSPNKLTFHTHVVKRFFCWPSIFVWIFQINFSGKYCYIRLRYSQNITRFKCFFWNGYLPYTLWSSTKCAL